MNAFVIADWWLHHKAHRQKARCASAISASMLRHPLSCVRVCPTSALTLVSSSELQQRSFKKQQQAARDNADIRLL